MSQSQRQSQKSPYPREDFVDETDNDELVLVEYGEGDLVGHVEYPGTSRAKWVTKQILWQGATHLCPITLNENPEEDEYALHTRNARIELSDPQCYITEDPAQQATNYGLYRGRVNEDLGYIVSGGTIADRPTEEFPGIVENVLAWTLLIGDIRHSDADQIRREVQSMKASGELHDTQIMTEVVRAMDYANGIKEHFEGGKRNP